jgi:hypothetical protein
MVTELKILQAYTSKSVQGFDVTGKEEGTS